MSILLLIPNWLPFATRVSRNPNRPASLSTLQPKKQIVKTKLKNGKYISNSKKVSYIKSKGELLDKTKVAIITGIATGSSGEVTALAFKSRDNTVFIGENTYGATTANSIRNLPFVDYMALTMGYDSDRNGK